MRSMDPPSFLQRLKRRKVVQWLLAYSAGGWLAFQAFSDLVVEPFGLSPWIQQVGVVLLACGAVVVVVLAWYHGEKGRQRVSGVEILILTGVLGMAGGVVALVRGGEDPTTHVAVAEEEGTHPNAPDSWPSVAVLPFDNLSPDPDNAYFAAGVHEEILTQLSKVGGIKLISRTSVLRYEDTEKSLGEIAGELGVTSVLEGSVQRAGDRVRITVQLNDARLDEHLWAERYDRGLSDIFAIQTEVATRIVEELRGVLSQEERARLASAPTDDLEAYGHYLRGHERFRRLFTLEATRDAVEAYQRTVELDPGFTAAWARLAQARLWLWRRYSVSGQIAEAETALARLEEMAPGTPEARKGRGIYLYWHQGRLREALGEFEALRELLPNDSDVALFLGAIQRGLGRWEDAVRSLRVAIELDPGNARPAAELAGTLLAMGRFDEARRYADLAASLNPSTLFYWGRAVDARVATGDTRAARAVVDSAARHLEPGPAEILRGWVDLLERRPGAALDRLLVAAHEGWVEHVLILSAARAAGREDLVRIHADSMRIAAERRGAQLLEAYGDERTPELLGLAHAYLGNHREALRIARRMEQEDPLSRHAYFGTVALLRVAKIYTLIGRHDDAVDRLRELLSVPSPMVTVPMLRMDPTWDPLRRHAGFQALLKESE